MKKIRTSKNGRTIENGLTYVEVEEERSKGNT